MGVTINEEKKVTILVNNEALEMDATYVIQTEKYNEVGIYAGFDNGYLVFKPILGDVERRLRPSTVINVKKMA